MHHTMLTHTLLEGKDCMTPKEYQQKALATLVTESKKDTFSMCGLGLSGEVGEINDILKKWLFHKSRKPLDTEKLKDEIGDVLWYLSILAFELNLTLEEIMEHNIAKLEQRHGNGFRPRYESDSGASE